HLVPDRVVVPPAQRRAAAGNADQRHVVVEGGEELELRRRVGDLQVVVEQDDRVHAPALVGVEDGVVCDADRGLGGQDDQRPVLVADQREDVAGQLLPRTDAGAVADHRDHFASNVARSFSACSTSTPAVDWFACAFTTTGPGTPSTPPAWIACRQKSSSKYHQRIDSSARSPASPRTTNPCGAIRRERSKLKSGSRSSAGIGRSPVCATTAVPCSCRPVETVLYQPAGTMLSSLSTATSQVFRWMYPDASTTSSVASSVHRSNMTFQNRARFGGCSSSRITSTVQCSGTEDCRCFSSTGGVDALSNTTIRSHCEPSDTTSDSNRAGRLCVGMIAYRGTVHVGPGTRASSPGSGGGGAARIARCSQ